MERLLTIRGVGPWTVEMMIFKLGRADVLPTTDFAIRKAFAALYKKTELPTPKELSRYGERWKPFRTTAALYLWKSLHIPK
jgi:DNA-3-methyladenine glycosylase II